MATTTGHPDGIISAVIDENLTAHLLPHEGGRQTADPIAEPFESL